MHETIRVGSMDRSYWVAPLPVRDTPGPPPLLLVLHGAGAQGPGTAALTGLHHRATAAGFVAVFPDGHGRVWNDSRDAPAVRRHAGVDDVGFLQALVARFASDGRARADGVFLTGISNGALMSEHIARQGLLPVAGIGLVAGPGTQASRAARPQPASAATVVIFSGTADLLIPYAGGPIGPLGRMVQRRVGGSTDRGLAVAAESAAADWAAANGVDGSPAVEEVSVASDDPRVTRLVWRAPGRPSVVVYRIDGGGHTWPGGPQYLPVRFVGRVARSLDASGIILDEFRASDASR